MSAGWSAASNTNIDALSRAPTLDALLSNVPLSHGASVRDANIDEIEAAATRAEKPLSIQQAADRLGVSRNQLVQMLERGVLAFHFDGWTCRIRPEDIRLNASRMASSEAARSAIGK